MRTARKWFMVLVAVAGGTAARAGLGDDPEPGAVTPPTPPQEEAPRETLRGPQVEAASAERTLIEYDFNGRLKRLEGLPEEAALDLLKLKPAERKAAEEVLAKRAALMDTITAENLDLLVKLQTSVQGGDRADAQRLLRELAKKYAAVVQQGTLKNQVRGVLPAEQADTFATLVDEYWKARIRDAQTAAGKGGERLSFLQAGARETLRAFGQEIRASFERQVTGRQAEFEELLKALELDTEQDAAVRKLVREHFEKYGLKKDRGAFVRLVADVMVELKPEQRKKLFERLRDRPAAPAVPGDPQADAPSSSKTDHGEAAAEPASSVMPR